MGLVRFSSCFPVTTQATGRRRLRSTQVVEAIQHAQRSPTTAPHGRTVFPKNSPIDDAIPATPSHWNHNRKRSEAVLQGRLHMLKGALSRVGSLPQRRLSPTEKSTAVTGNIARPNRYAHLRLILLSSRASKGKTAQNMSPK